jgi:hypothetical protein
MSTENVLTTAPDFDPTPVFFPYASERITKVRAENTRFVHYTSSEVAVSILENKTVWMRNALVMNDWQEVEYGMKCFRRLRTDASWTEFCSLIDSVYEGMSQQFCEFIDTRLGLLRYETFLTSLSEHLDSEDNLGRLSMWRAYGGNNGVALVVNQAPFMYVTHISNLNSCPVLYTTQDGFVGQFSSVIENVRRCLDEVGYLGRDRIFDVLTTMYLYAVLGTKHPGFHEEREWRVIYMPWIKRPSGLKPSRRFVSVVYQTIYEVPLVHDESIGLHKADIPNLLNRLIIGPTQNSVIPFQAFTALLSDTQIEEPWKKIVVSNIPLRR